MNWELIDVQLGLENVEEERDQIANVCWIVEKAKDFQENTYFCYTDYTNAFHCVDNNKYLWKILKKNWEHQTTLPVSWETCIWVKKQLLVLNMEQLIDSNWEMNTPRLYIVTPLI